MPVFKRAWPTERFIKPGLRTRIFIPQRPQRVLEIPAGDAVRKEVRGKDTFWFTLHRKGVRRQLVGVDPLEARAVPETQVRGYLHERILWKFLVTNLRLSVNSDFTFQSSFEGGRADLGGMVADFLFFNWRFVINVKGPTHYMFLQSKKDEEQEGILSEMGFTVYYVDLPTIESEFLLENWARRVFNIATSRGAGLKADTSVDSPDSNNQQALIDAISDELADVDTYLDYVLAYSV